MQLSASLITATAVATGAALVSAQPLAARAFAPTYRTYATQPPTESKEVAPKTSPEDSPAVNLRSESTQIREETAAEGIRHQPDYNVAVDYRTSCVFRSMMSLSALLIHVQATSPLFPSALWMVVNLENQ